MFVKSIVVSELPESCAECIFSDWHEDEYACIPLGKIMTHDELISAPPPECPLEVEKVSSKRHVKVLSNYSQAGNK